MKEITRIHIAKVAYDIELHAKKELENYIAALELYAGDKELLDDIEIRITELLAERGVHAGGVISQADVAAVRAQLGEPREFASEDASAEMIEEASVQKRVYRDESDAILGGVLAGLGKYFGVDPLWVRIIFLVVLLGSFGTALLVYLILWIIIPPAQTAAERLRMNGQPVTLDSIKALGERAEPAVNQTSLVAKRVLRVGVGLSLVAVAIGALAAVAIVAAHVFLGIGNNSGIPGISSTEASFIVITFSFFAVAGILLSALAILLAYAIFRQVWNKRIGTSVVSIVVAGLLAFAGGVGTIVSGQYALQMQAKENWTSGSGSVPANFGNITSVTVLNDTSGIGVGNTDITIVYTVSNNPSYELQAPKGVEPEFVVANDGLSATIKVTKSESELWQKGYLGSTVLHVYGPALEKITTDVNSPSVRYEPSQPQERIDVVAKGSNLTLLGAYATANFVVDDGSRVFLDEATVGELVGDMKRGAIEAGVVRSLTVTIPDACPVISDFYEPNALISIRAVSNGKIMYNGAERPAASIENNCGSIVIGA